EITFGNLPLTFLVITLGFQSSPFSADAIRRVSLETDGGAALDPILIVADSEQEALLLKVALRVAGVNNRLVFTTGHTETVDYFRRVTEYSDETLYPLPRIVLLYTQSLGYAGVDLIQQINRTAKDVLIAVVSGPAEENHIEGAYANGASCYLRKPEKPDDLVEMLTNFRVLWVEGKGGRGYCRSEYTTSLRKCHRSKALITLQRS
ncbi:MAG: hypothetical protein ABIO94_04835, partial [Opitutaceae bacterium]